MKKVVMLLIVGTVLVAAVPSVWAGPPVIKVEDPQPAPSWFTQLLSIFN